MTPHGDSPLSAARFIARLTLRRGPAGNPLKIFSEQLFECLLRVESGR